jgi:hypothetical protein
MFPYCFYKKLTPAAVEVQGEKGYNIRECQRHSTAMAVNHDFGWITSNPEVIAIFGSATQRVESQTNLFENLVVETTSQKAGFWLDR